jgi:sulfite reductase alpha subunit-like flavoprotein
LVRFGNQAETAEALAEQAAKAEANGFPHGVSTKQVDELQKTDLNHKVAGKSEVEKAFEVKQTGNNPKHHTVILPKPVTPEVANLFNETFVAPLLRK